jgi:methionyl-tRNA synthetase
VPETTDQRPRQLITSALPYINGVKHLGNLIGSMLPADVYARHRRECGDEVLFICATDEHGTPAELAAEEAGMTPEAFCREQYEVQRQMYERYDLSFDHFGRTSNQQNHELTQRLARELRDAGYIEARDSEQLYAIDDGRFLPDRYVIGTCPNCGYPRARGDQCENCTRQLSPTELIEPRSAVTGSTNLEVRSTRHLYLLQSKMVPQLREWIDTKGDWPKIVTSIARKWLDEGLEDRSITRDLSWGVPVPPEDFPGMEGKVFYVWFDAPIGYVGATKEWSDLDPEHRDWEEWWLEAEGRPPVRYTQFMGKDNVPFHTLSFPATMLGAKSDWHLVDRIKGFSWLNYYGGKFSTSSHRGVFMDQALELLPADYWRWYLLANAPETDDSDFTWELFMGTCNKDLIGGLGNLVNRLGSVAAKSFPEQTLPLELGPIEQESLGRLTDTLAAYVAAMDEQRIRQASGLLRELWGEMNRYLEQREPWRLVKESPEQTAPVLAFAACGVALCSVALRAFLPATSTRLEEATTLDLSGVLLGEDTVDQILALAEDGVVAHTLEPKLFQKLEQDVVDGWKAQYAGSET